ncbi:MAG: hypothetical protein MJH10_09310 [Epibacterium sp.]|nr:hypothetical protein [Epibacterium sp.]NQX73733.1 hypothetical protein [Epibacterium sp.]
MSSKARQIDADFGAATRQTRSPIRNFTERSVEITATSGTVPLDVFTGTQFVVVNNLTGGITFDFTVLPLAGEFSAGTVEFVGSISGETVSITTSAVGWTVEGPGGAAPLFNARGSFTYRTVPIGAGGVIRVIDSGQDFQILP